ncbi:nuclear transcription factor Y subunit beta [Coccidioides immitis RS]|uniref:Nuclear transcription factor Y subunit beta n=3 Tax=Coccidioides immitis TaxID=5501 RepID=J3KDV8_COCIM|nr:nuclear transcription factor Y subunit beta [Coccidioides immitis RS]EAS33598.3 nuclear transcription factor Y subunit beta [Coccidioides immitis RS]KMP04783.1 nuclear transcription factor Y subunit beta [Coccidioides immitis RMSCC 2394]KMU72560.1 CCAAT-binding transcription factor subunit A [Coccidioides immitis RMSCC 3703]
MAPDCKCCPDYEDRAARECEDCQRGQGVHAGMCKRIHLLHHQRSFGEVSGRKAQDCQWRGHIVRDDLAWFRELLGGFEDLSIKVSRNPILKGGEPEPASEQRIPSGWTRRRHWRRRRRRHWWASGDRTRLRSSTRECQQHFEYESGPERARQRDIRISANGRRDAQWCRWRDLLALAKTIPGSRLRRQVAHEQKASIWHLPIPRARQGMSICLALETAREVKT